MSPPGWQPEKPPPWRPRARPCRTCPYRRDVPSGLWDPSEYARLPGYDGDVPDQVAAGATALHFCNQRTGDLCAGWVGCHDMANCLAVRMQPGDVHESVYTYVSPVPLFASGAEAAAHGLRDIEQPTAEAWQQLLAIRRRAARRKTRED